MLALESSLHQCQLLCAALHLAGLPQLQSAPEHCLCVWAGHMKGCRCIVWLGCCAQVSKINKFTQSQVSALKKRLKGLRDQVRDSKDASKSEQLTQVRP